MTSQFVVGQSALIVPAPGQTIGSMSLSPTTYTAGVPNGPVGTVTVPMRPASPAFSGSLSVTGINSGGFQLSGTTLEENPGGTTGVGPYSDFNIVATQAGISNSPQQISPTVEQPGPISLTLVNDSSTAQVPGVPTHTFGQLFKLNDIPSGHVPKFTVGGVTQPFSAGMQRYWPNGSLLFATFQLLPTVTVAGNASQTVTITDGGAGPWPTASGRTLTGTGVYNQGMQMVCPPLSPSIGGRSGTISSWCNGDGNTYKVSKWLDGAAGTAWKISCYMASALGGTADGQLTTDYYVQALNNASGGAGGFRVLHQIRQPFYNYDGGLGKQLPVGFAAPNSGSPTSGLNWAENGNSHAWTWLAAPTSATFTTDGNGNYAWTTVPGWYEGAGGQGTLLPCVISGEGFYWGGWNTYPNFPGGQNLNTTGSLRWYSIPSMESDSSTNFPAGTYTATLAAASTPFTILRNATVDGRYNFFVGNNTSGIAAETTLRVQINQHYWQASGVLPPFDIASIGQVADTTYTYNWWPYSRCEVSNDTGNQSGGDQAWLGIFPGMCVNDFFTQSKANDRTIRIYGLAGGLWARNLKDYATDTNLCMLNATYTGVAGTGPDGPIYSTVRWAGRGLANGFTPPPNLTSSLGMADDMAHEPNLSTWAYIRTGELQYLDYMVDTCQWCVSSWAPQQRNPRAANGDSPYDANGVVTWVNTQARAMAWANRGVQFAALFYSFDPTGTNPVYTETPGSQLANYLNDLADAQCKFPIAQFGLVCADSTQYLSQAEAIYNTGDPGSFAYCSAGGFWLPLNSNGAGINTTIAQGAPFENGYFALSMCVAAIRGNLDAKSFLQNIYIKNISYIGNKFGWWHNYSYVTKYAEYYPPTPPQWYLGANPSGTPISSDARFAILGENWNVAALEYTQTGPNYWNVNNTSGSYDWAGISNGDKYIPNPYQNQPPYAPQMDYNHSYYVRDLTGGTNVGATFNLAEDSPSNPAVAIVSGKASSLSIVSGGGSYSAGDVLTVVGGTFAASGLGGGPLTITVNSVNGSGVIQTASVNNTGYYTVVPSGTFSVTGGTGSGATFTAGWSNLTFMLGTLANPPLTGVSAYGLFGGYAYQFRAVGCWCNVLGITGCVGGPVSPATTVVNDVNYRILNTSGGGGNWPGLLYGEAQGGNYIPTDARYAYQETLWPTPPMSPPS